MNNPASTSLLKLQIGPVQEFIAAARSTRDLWSGSYLISWMMAQSIVWLRRWSRENESPIRFVFPFIPEDSEAARPPASVAWIENRAGVKVDKALLPSVGEAGNLETLETAGVKVDEALLPSVPNILLAQVPREFGKEQITTMLEDIFVFREETAFRKGSEWWRIAGACLSYLDDQLKAKYPEMLLQAQERERWEWQLRRFWQTNWQIWPLQKADALLEEYRKIPVGRTASAQDLATLNDWMANYQLLSHRFDARRQTRDFDAWQGEAGVDKDSLTGREEAVITQAWLSEARKSSEAIRHLFRKNDDLGAASVIKRVWHRAYLMGEGKFPEGAVKPGFKKEHFYIPSTLGIAAFPWAVRVRKTTLPSASSFHRFCGAVETMGKYTETPFARQRKPDNESHEKWLARVDWQVFQEIFWQAEFRNAANEDHRKAAQEGLAALRALINEAQCGRPGKYYAVLVMDGDGMGKWLSGKKFGKNLTQKMHGSISRGLEEATRKWPRLIVEDPFEKGSDAPPGQEGQGKLIYSGADDVLAILPAGQALSSALSFRNEFVEIMNQAVGERPSRESFAISAGIAIGHIKEPLQDLAEVAWNELRRAKNELGGDAAAVTLFKRSGEMVTWGAKFSSHAFPLLRLYQEHSRQEPGEVSTRPPISGRFAHRLTEMLCPHQDYELTHGFPDPAKPIPLTKGVADVAEAEIRHLIAQQTAKKFAGRDELIARSLSYLTELRPSPGRPLCDFYSLFQLEAFIATQED